MSSHNEKFYENDNGVYFKSGYLSQWHIVEFKINNKIYNCCEQFMMEQKALLFGDYETADLIMKSAEPKEQKKLGRTVKNFNESKWNTVADDIVYNANLAKFSQNLELKKKMVYK